MAVDPTQATPPQATPRQVEQGDTLWKISNETGISINDLVAANKDQITNPENLKVNTQIKIPTQSLGTTANPATPAIYAQTGGPGFGQGALHPTPEGASVEFQQAVNRGAGTDAAVALSRGGGGIPAISNAPTPEARKAAVAAVVDSALRLNPQAKPVNTAAVNATIEQDNKLFVNGGALEVVNKPGIRIEKPIDTISQDEKADQVGKVEALRQADLAKAGNDQAKQNQINAIYDKAQQIYADMYANNWGGTPKEIYDKYINS